MAIVLLVAPLSFAFKIRGAKDRDDSYAAVAASLGLSAIPGGSLGSPRIEGTIGGLAVEARAQSDGDSGEKTVLQVSGRGITRDLSISAEGTGAWLAKRLGNPRAILLLFVGLGGSIVGAFIVPRGFGELAWFWLPLGGFFGGVFALFTMYLPPLFPTLLRTTGAGFCYNIGRIAAAVASIVFGWLAPVGDFRTALLWAGLLAFLAAFAAWWLPENGTAD